MKSPLLVLIKRQLKRQTFLQSLLPKCIGLHPMIPNQMIIMLKISFFQWFNNVICAISFAYIGTKANPSCIEQGYEWFVCPEKMGMFVSGWYPTGAHLILNALIGDLIIINFVMDCFRPPEFIQKYVIAKRARTQARMNELRSVPADITLAFRVQMMNKFVTLGLMFSFGIPILYVILGVYGWLSAWIDRFNFLRQLRPPPETHDRQMAWVVNKIFPFAILLHLWMAVIFYRDVCLEQIGALGPASGTEVDVLAELRNSSALGARSKRATMRTPCARADVMSRSNARAVVDSVVIGEK